MPDSDSKPPLSPNDSQSTELRMRRALGLQGPARPAPQQRVDQARPRHRFVQDGGVPVVVLNSRGDSDPVAAFKTRISELEAALEAERAAHGATKRFLNEAQANVQAVKTRLVHAEFAHNEAIAAERRARKDVEEAMQVQVPLPEAPSPVAPKLLTRKVPKVPRVVKMNEPQPVKWWLPNFREKLR